MATRNGARHLPAQLASIAAQTHDDWSLVVSDDGSHDDSRALVRAFAARHPGRDIRLVQGPGQGAAANFLNLLERFAGGEQAPAVHVALADQDDVWMPHRLTRALKQLSGTGTGTAPAAGAVYASRTILTDPDLRPRGPSPRMRRGPSFANALVQNILAGNTIVLDPAAAGLLARTAPAARAAGVPYHDWWIYQIASGAGARVILDDRPGLYYRQHEANTMGAHRGLPAVLARARMVLGGDYRGWIDANLRALDAVTPELAPPARALLAAFADWRRAGAGRASLRALGIHRQSPAGDMLLAVLSRLGRI